MKMYDMDWHMINEIRVEAEDDDLFLLDEKMERLYFMIIGLQIY